MTPWARILEREAEVERIVAEVRAEAQEIADHYEPKVYRVIQPFSCRWHGKPVGETWKWI